MTRMNERDAYALMADSGDEQQDREAMHDAMERELDALDRERAERAGVRPMSGWAWFAAMIGLAALLTAAGVVLLL